MNITINNLPADIADAIKHQFGEPQPPISDEEVVISWIKTMLEPLLQEFRGDGASETARTQAAVDVAAIVEGP